MQVVAGADLAEASTLQIGFGNGSKGERSGHHAGAKRFDKGGERIACDIQHAIFRVWGIEPIGYWSEIEINRTVGSIEPMTDVASTVSGGVDVARVAMLLAGGFGACWTMTGLLGANDQEIR